LRRLARDYRRHRAEHGADVHRIIERAWLEQRSRRRPAGKALQGGDEPQDRRLPLGQPIATRAVAAAISASLARMRSATAASSARAWAAASRSSAACASSNRDRASAASAAALAAFSRAA
jgi:hypothetical protein